MKTPKSELNKNTAQKWPPNDIDVGTRVHYGVSSPDTGIVIKINRHGTRARVQWDKNGVRWNPMDQLFAVTRSLSEWAVYKQGKEPCRRCGYRHEPHTDLGICSICVFKESSDAE